MQKLMGSGGRVIDYLRISVTDRCNFRCTYCIPPDGVKQMPHEAVLTYDEIERVARVAAGLGVRRVRLTGGEPLARKGIVELVRRLSAIPGIEDIALTTNASLLADQAADLARAGLRRVNISLDSLKPGTFAEITRGGRLEEALSGIRAAERAGLAPIKINTVVMRGINDEEIPDLGRLSVDRGWHVRFIELMPVGCEAGRWEERFFPADAIMERLASIGPLAPATTANGGGPADTYRLPGALGMVGVISPVSRHFCGKCNRLRLTADGMVRSCLLSPGEVDVREVLRTAGADSELAAALLQAARLKPVEHGLGLRTELSAAAASMKVPQAAMSQVGG